MYSSSADRNGNHGNEAGYVQVYTGSGKGKTTAAIGLAVRAAGAGWSVLFAQFAKQGNYSEIRALAALGAHIVIRQYGRSSGFVSSPPDVGDIQAASKGLSEVREKMQSGKYRMVILDEANTAVSLGLFSAEELLELVKSRPPDVELIITGRGATAGLIEYADLVTEMQAVKHYYQAGVHARTGIEK